VSGLTLHTISGLTVVTAEGAQGNLVAQIVTVIVCFFLVYWVLKRYAFGPLLAVLDERQEHVKRDLDRAEEMRRQAEANHLALEERLRNIEREARERLAEAIAEGKQAAAAIQEHARQEAEATIEKARQTMQYEQDKVREEIKNDVINMTLLATERLIRERLDDEKHRQLINDFVSQIERN
jgi:F-type H+-transporting ATPase subunit b